MVAISRTEDYRHHWQDVTIGSILGTCCAYFAYRQYYPGLSNDSCRDPFLERVAFCRRGFDEEMGGICSTESNIALLNSQQSTEQTQGHKYQTEDGYLTEQSDYNRNDFNVPQPAELNPSSSSNNNIPLVGTRVVQ